MRILGNRVLISKVEEPKSEGFQTVDVQDSFVYKGQVEMIGSECSVFDLIGAKIYFAKYSPDIMEITHEGKTMKIVPVSDILAVL